MATPEQWNEMIERYTREWIRDLATTPPIDPTGDPLNCCSECGSVEPCDCFDDEDDEPPEASLTTGFVDGRASYE